MSQENFKVVREAVAALNQRDVDAYVACCADDVRLLPPTAAVEGAYEGRSGIRRFFADIQDAVPDFRLNVERMEAIGPDRVLVSFRATASGRSSGVGAAFPATTVYDLAGGKIKRARVFLDRDEAIQAAGL
jgi:ketosteroid isomerase-like protein